jgi:hypothetical protein
MCDCYAWKRLIGTWESQRLDGTVREFDEELDAGAIKMRMLAVWEADEAMNDGAEEYDHASVFLG